MWRGSWKSMPIPWIVGAANSEHNQPKRFPVRADGDWARAVVRRGGWVVNHKRVLRLMRADNLLCLRRRAFVHTTDSDHQLRVYPNLARDLKVSGLNQLWVADITYIRLVWEFVYLAVILDAFSRRGVRGAVGATPVVQVAAEGLPVANGRGGVSPRLG